MQQIAGAAERLARMRLRRSGQRLRRQPIGGGACVSGRERRRGHVEDRLEPRQRSGRRAHAIHLHHLHALKRDFGREEIANRTHVGAREIDRRQRAGNPRRVIAHLHLPLVVVVARDLVRRREDLVHRRVEPAVHARPDQLAADDQDQHRGHQRHREQQRDELGAEPRERQPAPPFHHQLHDVAREQPDEDEEDGEVGG